MAMKPLLQQSSALYKLFHFFISILFPLHSEFYNLPMTLDIDITDGCGLSNEVCYEFLPKKAIVMLHQKNCMHFYVFRVFAHMTYLWHH